MNRYILLHYSEIGLKKSNKGYFVNKLRNQIKKRLEQEFHQVFQVKHILSRLLVEIDEGFDEEAYVKVISRIFGIKNFQFVYAGSLDLDELGKQIWDNRPSSLIDAVGSDRTFSVRVKRSQKMETTSAESGRILGAFLLRSGISMPVKMKNPDFQINVEFFNDIAFFSYKKYEGMGGMSSGTGDKLVSMLSAGIDSPVAAFRMMKRGARVIFAHFHAYPYTDMSEIENVKKIAQILSNYQFDTRLFLFPFGDVQKRIATNLDVPPKYRILLYRRIMLRVAEKLSKKVKAKGVITGDSYAQVASQTADNLFAIHDVTNIPLFQPLISFDKEEIIFQAEAIDTYDISKLPCNDTCSMFSPEHPEIRASKYDLDDVEKVLPIDQWVEEVFEAREVFDY